MAHADAWAAYLEGTNDTAFVAKYFHDDASAPSQWGPSLYTIMHTDYLSQLTAAGYLRRSNDNDSEGTWLFDDETALAGLAAYRYIAARIGDDAEAQWADGAYASLLKAVNGALATNEQANDFSFLPCEVNVPITPIAATPRATRTGPDRTCGARTSGTSSCRAVS